MKITHNTHAHARTHLSVYILYMIVFLFYYENHYVI